MHDGEIVDLFLKRDEEALRIVSEQYGKRLNRPFVFEIVSESGLPIFVGIVNDPA